MSYLFEECSSLEILPDISEWNTSEVKSMKSMFSFCSSLKTLPNIDKWDIKKVTNISKMFFGCSSLSFLPEIGLWNTDSITDISYLFCKCSSLKFLPDISKWRTDLITDMSHLFHGCSSLKSLHNIYIWKTNNVKNMSHMFHGCSSLTEIPFISKWIINNVIDMSYMFHGCSSLTSLDISKWNTGKVIKMNMIFSECYKLKPLPDISNLNYKINRNNEDNNEDKDEIKVSGHIHNDNLKMIPQIELKFNAVDKYNKNLIQELKNELKTILKTDNFSIIEIKKGSLKIILTLQNLILNEIKNMDAANTLNTTLQSSFFNNINSEVEILIQKLKEHEFISLGTVKSRPDYVDSDIIDITSEENKKIIEEKILGIADKNKNNDINIIEQAKSITQEDLERYFLDLSIEANEQETNLNKIINRLDEFNEVFDEEIEKLFKKSIFEYKIDNIFLVDKDSNDYIIEKNKCPNKDIKILLHGTQVNAITHILADNINHARKHIFGVGAYFTDNLDYVWFYGGRNDNRENFYKIPKVNDFFTCVASEIYYDKSKLQTLDYAHDRFRNMPVPKKGIRCVYVDYLSSAINKDQLNNYKGFIGKEYILTEKRQYCPLYGITFRRVEYLVIWRDYNFNLSNPNNYSNFEEMKEFHRVIKKYIYRELNSKIYYTQTNEEALELLDRKKYNKVILMTNGNNNGVNFINEARRIIGANSIAAVSCYEVSSYINIVENMENVLILNGINLHKKFINCIIKKDKNLYTQLKEEINEQYNSNLNDYTENLFNYPNFKSDGSFRDLTFDSNKNLLD
jgi:surface protein